MAKSIRRHLLHGGPLRFADSESVPTQWSKFLRKRTADDEETSETASIQGTPSLQQTMSDQKSSMSRNKSKASASSRDERRNNSSTRGAQNQARAQDCDVNQEIDVGVLHKSLGPHGKMMKDLVELLRQVEPRISEVLKASSQHTEDLDKMEEIYEKNGSLRAENAGYMHKIKASRTTFEDMVRLNDLEKKELIDATEKLDEERSLLNQKYEEFKQKAAKQDAKQAKELDVERERLSRNSQKLEAELQKNFAEKERHLEDMAAKKIRTATQEYESQQTKLHLDRENAEERAKSLEKQLEESKEENRRLSQQNRDYTGLKEFLDDKNKRLSKQLDEFSTHGQPLKDYTTNFKKIETDFREIASERYLRNFQNALFTKELEGIHQKLIDTDVHFKAVPISNTDVSSRLCSAHIQRVIALNVVQTIWKPFSCDGLVGQDGLSELLLKIQPGVAAETHMGSRQSVFWATRTCRALQNLHLHQDASESKTFLKTATHLHEKTIMSSSARAEKTYHSIMSVIQPLIEEASMRDFQERLISILDQCVTIWDQAMTDEMWFEAQISLSSESYESCRSQEFDPSLGSEKEGLQAGETTEPISTLPLASSSSTELLTLFPLVRVRHPDYDGHSPADHKVPGRFPEEGGGEEQARMSRDARTIEVLHPGSALAMASELVVMGITDVKDQLDCLEQARIKAAEQYKDSIRHRRYSSLGSATTLTTSVEGPE